MSARRARAVLVTQWFPPEPVVVPVSVADALAARRLEVQVLTGIPNFPSGQVQPGWSARRGGVEVRAGYRVTRAPLYPSHDRSAARRVLNYLSWGLAAAWSGRRLLAGADVALVYGSPITAALPAVVASRRHGTPFVLLVQDVWPDSILSTGLAGSGRLARAIVRVTDVLVRAVYRRAAAVAVISPGMLELLASRGVPREKLALVYNWVPDAAPAVPVDVGARIGHPGAFIVLYAGNHGAAQSLHSWIEAMSLLGDLPDVHLVLIGDGVDKAALRGQAGRTAPDRVHLLDPVPASEVTGWLAGADVQAVSLRDDPLFEVTMPSKLQGVLAAGQPVIVAAGGDAGSVPGVADCGWQAAPGDPRSIAAAIRAARTAGSDELARRGANGRAHYERCMSEAVNGGRLAELLHAAVR